MIDDIIINMEVFSAQKQQLLSISKNSISDYGSEAGYESDGGVNLSKEFNYLLKSS
jgi:hypothetical protein